MLLIKLSAEDLRLIDRAQTPADLEGAVAVVRDRIQQANVLKSFGREPGPNRKESSLRWDVAWQICHAVLGDDVYRPPAPEYRWFGKVNGAIRGNRMDEAYVQALAEYVKTHIPGRNSFMFIITAADRILAGEFDKAPKADNMEVLRTCQLPEIEV